jgi:outer membrane protein assembly factor BamB
MNFAHLLRCFLLSFIHLSVYLVDANLGKLQSAGAKGLERSVLVRRLLLVVTLDGTLYAFDKYTGALYWKTANLGNSTITGSYSKEHTPTNPVYIVEPQGPGSIYAYIPGSGVKVRHMALICILCRNFQ